MNNTTILTSTVETTAIISNITTNTLILVSTVVSNSSLLTQLKTNNTIPRYLSNFSVFLLTPVIYIYNLF
jgi:hypothetical protein